MVCPSCHLQDIQEEAKFCPRCGEVLAGRVALSEAEMDNIREKSILRGKIAELESRTKTHKSVISQLKTYVVLLLILFPISHFLCNQKKDPTISDLNSHIEASFATKQLEHSQFAIKTLLSDYPTFLYITSYGDNPESLSMLFYKTREYADTIIKDNYIDNDRRIPTGDTLIFRQNPKKIVYNILGTRGLQKKALKNGGRNILKDFSEFEEK